MNHTGKMRWRFFINCLIAFMLGWFGRPWMNAVSFSNALPTSSSQNNLNEQDVENFARVYSTIQQFYIDPVDKQTLMDGALKGMVQATGDRFSEYLTKEQADAFNEDVDGSFSGIGVQFHMVNDQATVITPIDDTPASKAGIQPNDVLLKADGDELTGLDSNEIMKKIRGKKGTDITLTIQRGETNFDVTLTRDDIPIITVTGEIDKNQPTIGHIRLSQFNGTTYDELVQTVKELREKGAKQFVIDLRYNPGGLLDQALKISNLFLEDGQTIMQMEQTGEPREIYKADAKKYGDFKITEPTAFITNQGSASASEILTAAIKENTALPVVGEKTFGKGSVQTVVDQADGAEVKITFARWLTPSGEWIHEKGIEPTDTVEENKLAQSIQLDTKQIYEMGVTSAPVTTIGLVLQQKGYTITHEMLFDETMEQAVKDFQKDHQLKPTGIVDEKTGELINEMARDLIKTNDPQYQYAVEKLLNK